MTNAQLQELLEVRIKVYNNLAAAQMKIAAFETALASVDVVLHCQPDNVKALFRKGKILESKGDASAAIPVLQKGATLDPDSKAIQQLLAKCIMKARRDERQEKDFYRKMMGQAQKADEKRQNQRHPTHAQSHLDDSGRDVPKVCFKHVQSIVPTFIDANQFAATETVGLSDGLHSDRCGRCGYVSIQVFLTQRDRSIGFLASVITSPCGQNAHELTQLNYYLQYVIYRN